MQCGISDIFGPHLFHLSKNSRRDKLRSKFWREEMFWKTTSEAAKMILRPWNQQMNVLLCTLTNFSRYLQHNFRFNINLPNLSPGGGGGLPIKSNGVVRMLRVPNFIKNYTIGCVNPQTLYCWVR